MRTLIAGCFFTGILIATMALADGPRVQIGDVNGDGVVNITDAMLTAQIAVGLRAPIKGFCKLRGQDDD